MPRHLHPIFQIALALVTTMSGCASREVSPFTALPPEQARSLCRQMSADRQREIQADLATAFADPRPRNILVLSGGDAAGAYGCGFLHGWRDMPGDPRPQFDIVTGVSTGALMSTAAFLGEPRDDADLKEIYTTIHDDDVFEAFTPSPPNSVFDTAPLQRLIAKHVTRETLKRVAAAHRAGRRLYVATVGLDQGRTVIWPLSRIAADAGADISDAALEKYRRILLAAAAIPMMFPPVEIDGDLQVDAGLREALFLRPEMLGNPKTGGEPTTVYAIVNAKIGGQPRPVGNDFVDIGARSLDLYTDSLVLMSLRNVARVALCHSPVCRFKYIVIPNDLDTGPGPGLFTAMFNPTVTQRLYSAGETVARESQSAWHEGLPRLDGDTETAMGN